MFVVGLFLMTRKKGCHRTAVAHDNHCRHNGHAATPWAWRGSFPSIAHAIFYDDSGGDNNENQ